MLVIGMCSVALGAVMAGFLALWLSQPPLTQQQLVAMTAEGDRIIAAAKLYLEQRGKPPTQMSDIVPQFLAELPAAADGWSPWVIAPKDPGGTDPREFAVRREIEGAIRRFRTGFTHIVCYVDPSGRQDWYARAGGSAMGSDSRFLRAGVK